MVPRNDEPLKPSVARMGHAKHHNIAYMAPRSTVPRMGRLGKPDLRGNTSGGGENQPHKSKNTPMASNDKPAATQQAKTSSNYEVTPTLAGSAGIPQANTRTSKGTPTVKINSSNGRPIEYQPADGKLSTSQWIDTMITLFPTEMGAIGKDINKTHTPESMEMATMRRLDISSTNEQAAVNGIKGATYHDISHSPLREQTMNMDTKRNTRHAHKLFRNIIKKPLKKVKQGTLVKKVCFAESFTINFIRDNMATPLPNTGTITMRHKDRNTSAEDNNNSRESIGNNTNLQSTRNSMEIDGSGDHTLLYEPRATMSANVITDAPTQQHIQPPQSWNNATTPQQAKKSRTDTYQPLFNDWNSDNRQAIEDHIKQLATERCKQEENMHMQQYQAMYDSSANLLAKAKEMGKTILGANPELAGTFNQLEEHIASHLGKLLHDSKTTKKSLINAKKIVAEHDFRDQVMIGTFCGQKNIREKEEANRQALMAEMGTIKQQLTAIITQNNRPHPQPATYSQVVSDIFRQTVDQHKQVHINKGQTS